MPARDDAGVPQIRAARSADFPRLQDIEIAAGRAFRSLGMDEIADDEPMSEAELSDALRVGWIWVAVDPADPGWSGSGPWCPPGPPTAYLVAERVDGNLHVHQVSVHPDHARRGIGRALIDLAAMTASASGLPAVTLTTFLDVPWNAPYYRRLGFTPMATDEIGPQLDAIREREIALGLDRWPRGCLRRPL